MSDERDFEQLQALRDHRAQHGAMPAETEEIVKEENRGGVIELSTFNWSGQLSSKSRKYLYLADVNNREIAMLNRKSLRELIALLQRAHDKMHASDQADKGDA